jgi:hypothetical protein
MSEQLARMIAHTEYTQRQASQSPILDFDRRGFVYTPGRSEQGLGMLRRAMTNGIAFVKDRLHIQHEAAVTRETPISENC